MKKEIRTFMENSKLFRYTLSISPIIGILFVYIMNHRLKTDVRLWGGIISFVNIILAAIYLYIYVEDIDIRRNQYEDWEHYKKITRLMILFCMVIPIAYCVRLFTMR